MFRTIITIFFYFYVGIGVAHSILFSFLISRSDCINPGKWLVWVFCNTGMGVSHFVTTLGWPLLWYDPTSRQVLMSLVINPG